MRQVLGDCECSCSAGVEYKVNRKQGMSKARRPGRALCDILRSTNQIMQKASKTADGFYSESVVISFIFQKVNSNNTDKMDQSRSEWRWQRNQETLTAVTIDLTVSL